MKKAKPVAKKKSRVNIVAIIGSYPWAMDQIIMGKEVKRAGWKDKTVDMISMDNFHPTATDKKRHDWQIVQRYVNVPADLPIDMPAKLDYETYAANEQTEVSDGYGWFMWSVIAVIGVIITYALYMMNSATH